MEMKKMFDLGWEGNDTQVVSHWINIWTLGEQLRSAHGVEGGGGGGGGGSEGGGSGGSSSASGLDEWGGGRVGGGLGWADELILGIKGVVSVSLAAWVGGGLAGGVSGAEATGGNGTGGLGGGDEGGEGEEFHVGSNWVIY